MEDRLGRDWHEIKKLYVFGEVEGEREDGTQLRRYPSLSELARRLGIPRSVIAAHSSRDCWAAARAHFQARLRDSDWRNLVEQELRRDAV